MNKSSCKNYIKRVIFIIILINLLSFSAIKVISQEEKVRYTDLEKVDLDEDSNKLLKEYYGKLLGYIGEKSKFNTLAATENIAVLNVTIDGKDRRIFARLSPGILFPTEANITETKLITTENLVVLGDISLRGLLYTEIEKTFGPRRLYGVHSANARYVDEGAARLFNGTANVSVNPILRELIEGYNVFLSAEGVTRGIYVAEKTSSYFIVKSLNSKSNVAFSWMLRGTRSEHSNEYLNSLYGLEKEIEITATIDYGSQTTRIKVEGLFNYSNQTGGISNLITGNAVDEFGLETDLTAILGDPTISINQSEETSVQESLPNISSDTSVNETAQSETVVQETVTIASTSSVLAFTLHSTDENYIINQIASVTGLSVFEVKKLIKFVYKEPESFEDELLDILEYPDWIKKVNGSVIVSVG